jgi:hypothetical protein
VVQFTRRATPSSGNKTGSQRGLSNSVSLSRGASDPHEDVAMFIFVMALLVFRVPLKSSLAVMIRGSCLNARSALLTKCAPQQAFMTTVHGGSFSNASTRSNRLIFCSSGE